MSLFSTLNLAVRGLHASQTAIDVTGQNISNANTEGYSRKRVSLEASIRADDMFGANGMGVEVTEISRIRDAFIDQQTHEQLGGKGYYAQVDKGLERLENLFKEPFDGSINDGLNNFFNAWQDLANNPADPATREVVKAAGTTLTDLLHNLSTEMQNYRDDTDAVLVKKVEETNNILGRISELNAEISLLESKEGFKANDSRDQRDLLVRKLSEILDVRAIEDDRGNVSITSGGTMLVGPVNFMKLETYTHSITRPDGVQFSTVGVRLEDGKKVLNPLAGEIRGLLDIKERIIPGYEQNLDAFAAGLVREVNAIHQTGYSLNKTTGINFFDPANTDAAHIRLSDAILSDSKNIAPAQGGTSVPATVVPAGGIPPAGSPTVDLKTVDPRYRFLAQDSVQITLNSNGELLQEGAGKDYIVDYTLGTVTFLNYARFAGGEAVSIDFRYEQNGFPGQGDGANALALAQLRQRPTLSPDLAGNATQTFGDYYSSMVGTLGVARNQNLTNLEIKESLIAQMDDEQAAIAGVSLDEEMTNLIRFQHSYQASARIVGTVQDMMDTLMNM